MEADSNQDKKYSGEKAQSQRKQNAGKEAEAAPATSSPPFLLRRFERLPDEILVDILLGLPTASLIQITLVSHRFNAVSGEAWKRLCIQRYHNVPPLPSPPRARLSPTLYSGLCFCFFLIIRYIPYVPFCNYRVRMVEALSQAPRSSIIG